jgi:hypothetical protein
MGCTDTRRHEFTCCHPRRIVRWGTYDGCTGEVCVTDAVHVIGRWADVTSAVELYPHSGIPIDPAHRHEGERQIGAVVDDITAHFPPPVTHDYRHGRTSDHDHDHQRTGVARYADGSHDHPDLSPDEVRKRLSEAGW